jgi:hypothetical protein
MGMFSIHYSIRQDSDDNLYWGGGLPGDGLCWVRPQDAVRFKFRDSAERVMEGVLHGFKCVVEEDE